MEDWEIAVLVVMVVVFLAIIAALVYFIRRAVNNNTTTSTTATITQKPENMGPNTFLYWNMIGDNNTPQLCTLDLGDRTNPALLLSTVASRHNVPESTVALMHFDWSLHVYKEVNMERISEAPDMTWSHTDPLVLVDRLYAGGDDPVHVSAPTAQVLSAVPQAQLSCPEVRMIPNAPLVTTHTDVRFSASGFVAPHPFPRVLSETLCAKLDDPECDGAFDAEAGDTIQRTNDEWFLTQSEGVQLDRALPLAVIRPVLGVAINDDEHFGTLPDDGKSSLRLTRGRRCVRCLASLAGYQPSSKSFLITVQEAPRSSRSKKSSKKEKKEKKERRGSTSTMTATLNGGGPPNAA